MNVEDFAMPGTVDLYKDLYKPWCNKLAELERRESLYVIWAYSQKVSINNFAMPKDIAVHPSLVGAPNTALNLWELEILAGEILLNAGEGAKQHRTLKDGKQLYAIVLGLRSLENEIYGAKEGEGHILIELWRIAHRQFTWQQKRMAASEMVRYYLVYADETIDRICTARLGLSIDDVYLIDMMFLGVYLRHPRQAYPIKTDVPGITVEKVDKWLQFASTNLVAISAALKKNHKLDETYAYRYSALREFPIIRDQYAGADELLSPVPILVHWRITVGLYYALMPDKDFPNALGSSYQRVCGEILTRGLPSEEFAISPEAQYGTKQKPKNTPDWIVSDKDNSTLLIECKAARATIKAKEGLSDLTALEQDFEKLAEAVVQVYQRIVEYKEGQWPQLAYSKEKLLFPFVVTLEDWFLFGPRIFKLLDDKVRAGLKVCGVDQSVMDDSPYSVISVNDLEQLVQIIAAKGIFEVVAGKLLDDGKRTWLWHGYLKDLSHNIKVSPTLFEKEWDAMFKKALEEA